MAKQPMIKELTPEQREAMFDDMEAQIAAQLFGSNGAEPGAYARVQFWAGRKRLILNIARKLEDKWCVGVRII